ncbi:hypothetical protein ACF0H5_011951 [Mactra antiquata]
MDRIQTVAEFDIVRSAPHDDLVLFDNVISCYPCDKDITANYVLGNDVTPSSWDWIGIFRSDWKYLGEYLTYRWAQSRPSDCTAHNRRAVSFPASLHQIPPNSRDLYQLLYVSYGNHVVGVSSPFKVTDCETIEDFNIEELFSELAMIPIPDNNRIRKAECPASDTYEIVNELPCPSLPKRRATTKQKITRVYRDPNTLMNVNPNDWINKLKLITVSEPIVQEFRLSQSVVNQQMALSAIKLYDVNRGIPTIPGTSTGANWYHASIEYTPPKQLKAGPISFLLSLKGSNVQCSSFNIAKTLVEDLLYRETGYDDRIRQLRLQSTTFNDTNSQTEESNYTTAGLLEWALTQVQDDNRSLQRRVDQLEELLAEARAERVHRSNTTTSTFVTACEEECGIWIMKDPRRIARLKKAVGRQSRNLQTYRQMNEAKQRVISNLKRENERLRKLVQNAFKTSEKFREVAEEMYQRIKDVLAERAKDHTNEWRQFVRTMQENTTQTSSDMRTTFKPNNIDVACCSTSTVEDNKDCFCQFSHQKIANKQIVKLQKSEQQTRSKLHKRRSEAEQCPTCGLKFSKKADRHVIEEHIVFHETRK